MGAGGFDWVIIKFSDPSEGSVNMSIFPPHWQLMAVDFLTKTNIPPPVPLKTM